MTEQDNKGIPQSDSGYGTGGEDRVLTQTIADKEARMFQKLVKSLQQLEFNAPLSSELEKTLVHYPTKSAKQMELFEQYLRFNISEEAKKDMHFKMVDRVIKDKLINSNLPRNEGSAFLAIARVCANQELLKKVIEIISEEKDAPVKDLLEKYIDPDGDNTLHCLGRIIIAKYTLGLSITDVIDTYNCFQKLAPNLATQRTIREEDEEGDTPADIIKYATGIEIDEIIRPRSNSPTLFSTP